MKPAAMVGHSLRSILGNPARSFLTVLGIVIGIAAVISLLGISKGLEERVTSQLRGLDATRITVSSQDPERASTQRATGPGLGGPPDEFAFAVAGTEPNLTRDDYAALAALPNVATASPSGQSQVAVTERADEGKATAYQLQGVSKEYADMSDLQVAQGTWLNSLSDRHVVLGHDAARDLDRRVGQRLWIEGEKFTVVGVLTTSADSTGIPSPMADVDDALFTGYRQYLRTTDTDAFSSIELDAVSEEVAATVAADAQGLLQGRHAGEPDYTIRTNKDLLSTIAEVSDGFSRTLTGIAGISLLVGGIGIMNVMLMAVTERTREVGLRRAVGAKRRHILAQFMSESVVLTSLGGLIGVLVGYLLAGSAGQLLPASDIGAGPPGTQSPVVDAAITADTVLLAVAMSVVLGLIFGIFPAMRAARLDPATALRYE